MTIEVLYPEIANLYGELSNVDFLKQSGATVINTKLRDKPAFTGGGIDMVYMGAMTERSQELAIKALRPYTDDIRKAIENNIIFLVTGNALEIFGGTIENEDGTVIDCLGIYDTVAKRQMMKRYNSIFLGKFEDMDIVGYKSQFSHSYGGDELDGIFEAVRGDGLCPGKAYEGIRINNFFGTYLIGPLLIVNPPFAKYLMNLAGDRNVSLAFEEEAMAVYEKRVKEFSDPKTRVKF